MSTADITSACANCGKGGEGCDLKICTACKMVKYCHRDCQIAHRPQHKKACKKRAAELHDDALFREPPPQYGDCPICFLRMPTLESGQRYMSCCGKTICGGCCHADVYDNQGNVIADEKCPFCRTPFAASDAEIIRRLKKRTEVGDAHAFLMMGSHYGRGEYGLPQDSAKAIEFWYEAGKHGYANLGHAYAAGYGVERDTKMAKHYHELAAMEGDSAARCNLGVQEYAAGNYDRALKHFTIAVRGGCTDSVKNIQRMYKEGHATKDDYANALQSYQAYLNEIKSSQRDEAAERHKYY